MLKKKRELIADLASQANVYVKENLIEKKSINYKKTDSDPDIRYSSKDSSVYSRKRFQSLDDLSFDHLAPDYNSLSGQLREIVDDSFSSKLIRLIDERKLKDSQVYKAALIDRRLFSKIVSDRLYSPSKDTCIALAFALELTLNETDDLLERAGYTLSNSSERDLAIKFLLMKKVRKVIDVNRILFELNYKPLGR